MNYSKVHIFTQHGATYSFKDVTDFNQNETVVSFTFTAQSDGQVKRAVFFVKCIVGFTTMS
jgi:hypothetical protein